ncbi:MAG TPA: thymidine kinase [Bacteroidia bacterium]|jgi:thymidine kinase|nr:thymidine kinase [Bacteroidia bacterium]
MFLEIKNENRKGWIEVICGSMFSGKTEELIRRLKRAEFAQQKIQIFKPQIDTRYDALKIVSHEGREITSIPVQNSQSIQLLVDIENTDVVGIDEGQFFDSNLVEVATYLANHGIRVIIAGLDMDYKGNPFGVMPQLLAVAEYVTKVHAICVKCGNLAYVSHRISSSENLILLGEKDSYIPLCRQCFNNTFKKEQ